MPNLNFQEQKSPILNSKRKFLGLETWNFGLGIILFVAIALVSCRKKIELPGWDVDVLFPVAFTSVKISDIVKDSSLKENPDKSLSLVYSGEVYKLNFDSLFKIPDTTVFQSFNCWFCGAGIWYPPNSLIINQTQSTKYNLNQIELVEAIVRSGSIEVELSSTFPGKTVLNYQMPLATLNNIPLSVTDTLPAASPGNPSVIVKSYDLSGYKIDLRGLLANNFNTLVSSFKATTLDSAFVTSADSVKILNTFKTIVPEYARGYFGQTTVNVQPVNQAVSNLFNVTESNIDLENISLTMKIINGIGVDIQFLLNEIISGNSKSGKQSSLSSSLIGKYININRAANNFSGNYPPITYSEYIITMNSENSNADALLEINPDSIKAGADIILNPLGNVSNSNDFVYYNHGINVSLDAELPLSFIANNLVLIDTVAINFKPEESEDKAIKKIIGGNLILNSYNGYPFSAKPQLFLMDTNYVIADSIVADGSLIVAAELDGALRVKEKKFSQVFMPVSQQKIDALKNAKYIMFRFSFTTAGQPDYVKIYSDYSLDAKLVADLNYLIEN